MTQDSTPASAPDRQTHPRRRWRRLAIATLLGGAVAGIGAKVFAQNGPSMGHHCGTHRMHAGGDFFDQNPEAMQQRIEAFVKWGLADVNATEAQQKQISSIANAAIADLKPLRERHHELRGSIAKAIAQPTVDRAALESLRTQEIDIAQTASKRVTQAIGDAAEVLSPDQRRILAEKMQQRRHRWS